MSERPLAGWEYRPNGEVIAYMNSGGALSKIDLEAPIKVLIPAPTPLRGRPETPPCRICNQGRSGLPGDNHADCKRREKEWTDAAWATLSSEETTSARLDVAGAQERLRRSVAAQMASAGVPDWLATEVWTIWNGDDEDRYDY